MQARLIQIPSITPGIQRYLYKSCSVCLSDEKPRNAVDLPYRVVSIVDHTGRDEPTKQDLQYILESCGLDMSTPIIRATSESWGDPLRGNTQYYMQPLWNCKPVDAKPA